MVPPYAVVLARRTHLRYLLVSSCRRVLLRVGRGMACTVRKALYRAAPGEGREEGEGW